MPRRSNHRQASRPLGLVHQLVRAVHPLRYPLASSKLDMETGDEHVFFPKRISNSELFRHSRYPNWNYFCDGPDLRQYMNKNGTQPDLFSMSFAPLPSG
jgi:hypothetical protein